MKTTQETVKQTIQRATAELMADMIKESRRRWAAQPQTVKSAIIRDREDRLVAYLRG